MYGGPAGAVLAPILAWTLLRRVSLGRAFLTCLLGAVVGSVVGAVVGALVTSGDRMSNAFTGVLAGSVIGTIASAVLLRRRTRRPAPLERSN